MKNIQKNNKHYKKKSSLLYARGFEPIPIAPGKKYPTLKGWPTIELPITPWPEGCGIGLRTGLLTAIDIDIYAPDMVAELLRCFDGTEIITRVGQPPKTLIPVICPELNKKLTSNKWADLDGVANQIELLSYGQQFVAYGIHQGTGKPYQWSGDLLHHSLPVIPIKMIEHLFASFNKLAASNGWTNITVNEQRSRKVCKIRKGTRKKRETGNKPGDLYNRCCSITDILQEYGWRHCRGDYWTRPGKRYGVSGTVYDDGTFWCFTSSTCLEPDRSYDCFGLLAMYEHAGDFAAAARALCRTMREVA